MKNLRKFSTYYNIGNYNKIFAYTSRKIGQEQKISPDLSYTLYTVEIDKPQAHNKLSLRIKTVGCADQQAEERDCRIMIYMPTDAVSLALNRVR